MRKQGWFRTDKLSYPDIRDIFASCEILCSADIRFAENQMHHLTEAFDLLSLDELKELIKKELPSLEKASTKKVRRYIASDSRPRQLFFIHMSTLNRSVLISSKPSNPTSANKPTSSQTLSSEPFHLVGTLGKRTAKVFSSRKSSRRPARSSAFNHALLKLSGYCISCITDRSNTMKKPLPPQF